LIEFVPVSPRISNLLARRQKAGETGNMPINIERTRIYTDYYKRHEAQYPVLKRAGALYDWCAKCTCEVFDDETIVGNLGPDEVNLNIYVEWIISWIDMCVNDTDEKFREAWQNTGGVYMSDEDRAELQDAMAFWKGRTISDYLSGILPDEIYENCANGTNNFQPPNDFVNMGAKCQGHYIANFNKAVNVGFGEILRQALEKLAAMKGKVFGKDARSHAFYRGVVTVCDGAILLAKRYAEACRKKAEVSPEPRRAELLKMAESLDWIMENPARTYWEGLEVMHLYQLMLSTDAQQHGQSYGRIDQYCGHLLEKDLREGIITPEQAQEYTDAFILKCRNLLCLDIGAVNDRIIELNRSGKNLYHVLGQYQTSTDGLNITIGGTDKEGNDATNEMTKMVLQSYGRLHIADPTIAMRIHDNTPTDVFNLAIESSKRSGGMPQFQNDKIIVPALMSRGLPLDEALNYSIVGCVEPAATGSEWPACGSDGCNSIWSFIGCLVFAINGGVHPRNGTKGVPCKKLYEYETFDEFREAVEEQARYSINWNIVLCNFYEQVYGEYFPCIAASVMMDGCMESGLDATWGGCKYNSAGLTCLGTSNVADSMYAIKKLCFDDKSVSKEDMYNALLNNWEGYEWLRLICVNEVPHYGNDVAAVDEQAHWCLEVFADHLRTLEGPRGNKYNGGTFTMLSHLHVGASTPATPDGRYDGDPLADAISPRQGFDVNGPTAYILSASKLPHGKLSNGDQMNIKFSPSSVEGVDGTDKIRQLIQTYFDLSGMQMQFNVVSTKQLHDAQEHPDEYKNLIVRIAGFSTYFVELSRDTQDDFITRSEQNL